MFEGFANVWTPVVPARALGEKPLAVTLAGETLALFRDRRGGVGALLDRCPHRGVALSLGRVGEDGCLSCPFHGWAFRADGACAHIPLNDVPEDRRARHAATALPVREAGGLLWVFTGKDPAGAEPEMPENLLNPGWSVYWSQPVWNAHWTRAMENMLDMPHLPFVHGRTIGRDVRARVRRDSVMRVSAQDEPWGFQIETDLDGAPLGGVAWRRPNGMVLDIPVPGPRVRMHVYCVPVDAGRTRMLFGTSRESPRGLIGWVSDKLNQRVALEDKPVVESSSPVEAPPPAEEVSVATDGPTLHFRRYYYRELRGSSASLVPASRLAGRRDEAAVASAPVAAE